MRLKPEVDVEGLGGTLLGNLLFWWSFGTFGGGLSQRRKNASFLNVNYMGIGFITERD